MHNARKIRNGMEPGLVIKRRSFGMSKFQYPWLNRTQRRNLRRRRMQEDAVDARFACEGRRTEAWRMTH